MAWRGTNLVRGRRPVVLSEAYGPEQIVDHIAAAEDRIAELEAALVEAIDWIEQDGCIQADKDVAASLRKLIKVK